MKRGCTHIIIPTILIVHKQQLFASKSRSHLTMNIPNQFPRHSIICGRYGWYENSEVVHAQVVKALISCYIYRVNNVGVSSSPQFLYLREQITSFFSCLALSYRFIGSFCQYVLISSTILFNSPSQLLSFPFSQCSHTRVLISLFISLFWSMSAILVIN